MTAPTTPDARERLGHRLVAMSESGHYPMQEAPPLLVAHIERFLLCDPG